LLPDDIHNIPFFQHQGIVKKNSKGQVFAGKILFIAATSIIA